MTAVPAPVSARSALRKRSKQTSRNKERPPAGGLFALLFFRFMVQCPYGIYAFFGRTYRISAPRRRRGRLACAHVRHGRAAACRFCRAEAENTRLRSRHGVRDHPPVLEKPRALRLRRRRGIAGSCRFTVCARNLRQRSYRFACRALCRSERCRRISSSWQL